MSRQTPPSSQRHALSDPPDAVTEGRSSRQGVEFDARTLFPKSALGVASGSGREITTDARSDFTLPTATTTLASAGRRMTTDEVAAALGYTQNATVLRLVREEGLPAVRFNRRYYYSEADVRAWMAERGLIAAADERVPPVAAECASSVNPEWVAAQVAKFGTDALRRAGELLLALSKTDQGGAA